MYNNYYGRLTESLINKYSQPINEAWSDTMPDWLKKNLSFNTFENQRRGVTSPGTQSASNKFRKSKAWQNAPNYSDYAKAKGFDGLGRPGYAKPKGTRSGATFDLFSKLKDAGIDLQNTPFISGDVPESPKDPRLQPPNIAFYCFNNGQVYAPGFNDTEKLLATADPDKVDYQFKFLPFKTLKNISVAFAYIDGNSIVADYSKRKVQARQKNRGDDDNSPLTRRKDKAGYMGYWYDYDKSGYQIIPPATKYADELKKMHLRKYADRLTKLESELRDTWLVYQDMSHSSVDMFMDDTRKFRNTAERFLDRFEDAVTNYKRALNEINGILSKGHIQDSEDFYDALSRSYFDTYMDSSKTYINQAKEQMDSRYKTSVLNF